MIKSTDKLYAIFNKNGEVVFTKGGSSTSSRPAVYKDFSSAKRVLKTIFTPKQIEENKLEVHCLFQAEYF